MGCDCWTWNCWSTPTPWKRRRPGNAGTTTRCLPSAEFHSETDLATLSWPNFADWATLEAAVATYWIRTDAAGVKAAPEAGATGRFRNWPAAADFRRRTSNNWKVVPDRNWAAAAAAVVGVPEWPWR